MTTYSVGDAVLTDYGAAFVRAIRDGADGPEIAVELDGVLAWVSADLVDPL